MGAVSIWAVEGHREEHKWSTGVSCSSLKARTPTSRDIIKWNVPLLRVYCEELIGLMEVTHL